MSAQLGALGCWFSCTGVRPVWYGRSPPALRVGAGQPFARLALLHEHPLSCQPLGFGARASCGGGAPSLSLWVLRPQRQGPLCPASLCGLQSRVLSSSWLAATPWRLSPSHPRQLQARARPRTQRRLSCARWALLGGTVGALVTQGHGICGPRCPVSPAGLCTVPLSPRS